MSQPTVEPTSGILRNPFYARLFGTDDRRRYGRIALFLLIFGAFGLDFAHGIMLGQDRILFGPIYRLRQTMAVAISRFHQPPAHGYLAYGSVIDVFNQNGFAIFPEESGKHLDIDGWTKLFSDGPELNRILAEALSTPIDAQRPPDIIRGNELGFADYVDAAFRLFGVKVSSLYYFYYLLLGVACLLYVSEFRRDSFLLYLLAIYLAGQYFLQNYARSKGLEINTIFNSRVLSALSLLPAAHIMFVLWRGQRPSTRTAICVGIQAALVAFIVSCRFEAMWQVLMIYAAAAARCVYFLLASRATGWTTAFGGRCSQLWPAIVLAAFVFASSASINLAADQRYDTEPKTHIFWHELLMGILSASPTLQEEYLGHVEDPYSDTMVYEAVINDLKARGDTTSPGVMVVNGQVTIDLWRGWGFYEDLVRSLTTRIIKQHPISVAIGIFQKAEDQMSWYTARHALARSNFAIPLVMATLAFLACWVAGGLEPTPNSLRHGGIVMAFFLAFGSITPAIEPSQLAVSSLLCFLAAIAIAFSYGAVFTRRMW